MAQSEEVKAGTPSQEPRLAENRFAALEEDEPMGVADPRDEEGIYMSGPAAGGGSEPQEDGTRSVAPKGRPDTSDKDGFAVPRAKAGGRTRTGSKGIGGGLPSHPGRAANAARIRGP